ncbi:FecR family protein [Janthinobacterium sp. CG3]|uniref:FecR family protein n=1 Tax=Janthinobacterium sp. CG3 TaxID=1075768 RepID=UPI00034B2198|nr:FecR domain-containing protein [Janthinobacterium sp. CG3]
MSGARPADGVAEQAAEWIVRLTADDPAERAAAAAGFAAWKRADARHATAAARLEGLLGQMRGPGGAGHDSRPARAALNAQFGARANVGRGKRLGAALALALLLAGPAWLIMHSYPPAYLAADLRSATGEWRSHQLADGSRITLNSASAVNLRFDRRRRALELVRGEVLVEVAREAGRPFVVETAHGSIRALGTRFVVRRDGAATELTMLESRTSVQAARRPGDGVVVSAGEAVRISADGVGPLARIDAGSVAEAWRQHQLVVQERPLTQVLDELARHRPGRIQYDRQRLAGMTVTAVLPLDDTDRALQLLLHSFPTLRVRTISKYLVLVD